MNERDERRAAALPHALARAERGAEACMDRLEAMPNVCPICEKRFDSRGWKSFRAHCRTHPLAERETQAEKTPAMRDFWLGGSPRIRMACNITPTCDPPAQEADLEMGLRRARAFAPGGTVARLAEAADTVQDTYEHALHLDDRDLNVGVCELRAALAAVRPLLAS